MTLDGDSLVGYLRAEYAASGKWRVASFFVGLIVALPAVASVVTNDAQTLYFLAVANLVLLAIWTWINVKYGQKQNAAHSARRAALIVNGLGEELSAGEKRRLMEKFTVGVEAAENAKKSDYYASASEPGPLKLLECLEESAFYSSKLHRVSANAWIGIVVAYAVAFAIVAVFLIPSATNDVLMMAVRIFFAATVFILSADVLGSLLAHWRCSAETSAVLSRIEIAKQGEVNSADALLIMEDYTSAIQSAPEIVPFVYRTQEASLNSLWAGYLKG
ncbi:hypothetical protein [Tropicimonas sp. S265A]|uniref:hypothetical protein n=1 Tax=Tropicimonas sp. S265A TaxID=3415134 RepID=UPI003C7AA222